MPRDPQSPFELVVATLPGWPDVSLVAAAVRAGATGVLNLEHAGAADAARDLIDRLGREAAGAGVRLGAPGGLAEALAADLPDDIGVVVLGAPIVDRWPALAAALRRPGRRLLAECTSIEHAQAAEAIGADALIAKGHEAGAFVGEETTYVLVQRLLAASSRPVLAHGGIGTRSMAAIYVAGGAGAVLDAQMTLARESTLPAPARAVLERFEGDGTIALGVALDDRYRAYRRPGLVAIDDLQALEHELDEAPAAGSRGRWREAIAARVGRAEPGGGLWPLGQDAAFAAPLARRFGTVAGILAGLRASLAEHVRLARELKPFGRNAPLARAHGTPYPILQGPMTRVSDTAAFARAVADGGGLPFLALALLHAPAVAALLEETRAVVGDRPWGVGILGFVPPELRQEQLEVVRHVRPPFAIIAGGRPDQARELEQEGIATYLHVPAPGLLGAFLEDGARRFIFEGRECGGHVGPRTSFVLWSAMIDVLADAVDRGVPAESLHVVFAGGVHDARSAAMAAAMAAPLAARGVRIGVLMGTAYLFTEEAVKAGAIVEGFQQAAIGCRRTVLFETGPGHAIRCVETPYFETFQDTKRRLRAEGRSPQEVRETLEALIVGRLRIASKGITRAESEADRPVYAQVPADEQRRKGMFMIGQVAALQSATRSIPDLHAEVAVGSGRVLDSVEVPETAPRAARASVRVGRPSDIAIIGLGCLLPGASDPPQFWRNLLAKADVIREVPKERFDVERYFDPDRKARDKIYSRWGGFLDPVPFDPMRYGIPPAALPSIDSMQLLTLEVVRQALDDAGYLDREGRELPRDTTSVILGVSGGLGDLGLHYGVRASLADLGVDAPAVRDRLPVWTEDSFAGILLNVVAGRVANRFNLGGVNYVVDAACASSLAAVYLGVSELEAGTSDVVIVGGVDTVQSPFGYMCFSTSQALSPRGRCRTFDETADGIVISEGLVALVLKRVEDAERDGDRIYAVIKAVAGSSDGRGKSLTAPRPEGQVRALARAYARAGVSPATVGLIEAHGTGTVVGDAAEVASLAEVFGQAGAAPESCAIGSAKSMVGHTKSAAGVTGLMKVALALKHKVLPPTLHVERPNPRLREAGTPFYVNTEARPWLSRADGAPRRAGVSAFGFGGTNFHAVLEEHAGQPASDEPRLEEWPAELLWWQSGDPAELNARLGRLQEALANGTPPALRDLAAAVCAERHATGGGDARLRLAIVASDVADLVTKLGVAREALGAGRLALEHPTGVYLRQAGPVGKVAWLFPGQGSQAPGMLGDLALTCPHLADALAEADRALAGRLGRPLGSFVYPPPSFSDDERDARMAALTDTVVAQPALGAVEVGIARRLVDLGLRPDMAAGHSYGEYVALWSAGVFDAETLFRLSHARGRIIKDSVGAQPGAMAAVSAAAAETARALDGMADVWVANLNAPRQTIVAGTVERIEEAIAALDGQGLRARRIPVACAFHSPLMETAKGQLAAVLAATPMRAPRFPVFSNAEAAPYGADPAAIARQLSEHLVRPVRFVDEILAMHDAGARVFVEVGPRSVLTGLARNILKGRDATIVATDVSERSALTQLLHVLGQLASAGHPVDADRLFHGRASRLDLAAVGRLKEAKPAPGWVVTGGGARRAGAPAAPAVPAAVSPSGTEAPARAAAPAAVAPVPGGTVVAERRQPPSVSDSPAATPDEVMLQYQSLMTQFLQTQASVMTAYLQGSSAAERPAAEAAAPRAAVPAMPVAAIPVAVAPAPAMAPPAPQPVPAAAAAPAAPAPAESAPDVAADLLQVVSDRTGYPLDMLGLDLNIEADLGIDSIKRVEILSATQRRLPQAMQPRVQASMDRLTGLKTLREIGDALVAMTGAAASASDAPAAVAPAPASPPAPAATPAGSAGDAAAQLLQIAGDRTGYPVEMLGLDLNIEADLGIDSIKRVEILSAFQRQRPAAEQPRLQSLMDRLASLKTFREILDAVASGPAAERAAPAAARHAVPAPKPQPAITVSRFTLTAVERPLEVGRPSIFPGRLTVIADDGDGAGRALAEALEAAGERAVRLSHRGLGAEDDGATGVDLTDCDEVAGALDAVRRAHGSIGAVVHLVALAGDRDVESWSVEDWRRRVQRDIKSLYCLARSTADDLATRGRDAGAALVAVTSMGGESGTGPVRDLSPSQGGVAAFVRTLAQEWPDVACRAVDVRADAPASEIARFVRAELGAAAGTVDVGYGPGPRTALVPAVSPLNGGGRDVLAELDEHAVVLVTGGARGITAEIAEALARRLRPTLVIAGRTPRPSGDEPAALAGLTDAGALRAALAAELRRTRPDVRPVEVETTLKRLLASREVGRTLAALEEAGARVEYHQIDVRDAAAFGALVDDIYCRHGRLDGVVHGAGVIEDKLLQDKTPESFDRVLHTKADSAFTLVKHLRPEGLRLLVFMSSVTATFGNRGQADYGAANGVMNALASWCAARWRARVVAVNWGPWDSAGMASPEIRAQFVARGIQPIPSEAGVSAFMKEVGAGSSAPPVVVIGDGPWNATAVAPGPQELHA